MDENNDLRLTIETARKNKNWARRCYAYELAMEYFSLIDPDCYELCSYCDMIPEFLEEKNECCLTRALGAVKVFVNKCADAPSIARPVTRVIIDNVFFSASTKVREIATDIILDFIEWEACNAVLKELMTGALRYNDVRSDECIKVVRYALLDFGPHVITVSKLIDFIAALVRNKSFLSIDDECSQLLIVIYKCLGPQVRVHFTQILDPDYLSAIEASFEEMRNIPIYHCRFVRHCRDNSSSIRGSDEEVFAVCRIPEPTSHPTYYGNEGMVSGGEGMSLEADQSRFRDFVREPYYRAGDSVFLGNENKGYWEPQRFDNVPNYDMGYEEGGGDQHQRNRLNAYDNEIVYDLLDNTEGADSVPELFRHVPDVFIEQDQRDYQWYPYNIEEYNDHPRSVSTSDKACQNDGCPLQTTNPFEALMEKLMDKYGTEDILYWLCSKSNSRPKKSLNDEGTKESRKIHQSRNCKSLEALVTRKEQTHKASSSVSNTDGRQWLPDRLTTCGYLNNLHMSLFRPKCFNCIKKEDNSIGKNNFPSVEKNKTRSLHVSEKKNENTTAEPIMHFGVLTLGQEYLHPNLILETKENVSNLVNTNSQIRTKKRNKVRTFFQNILFSSLKNRITRSNIPQDGKSFNKKLLFNGKRRSKNHNGSIISHLNENQRTNYFHQNKPMGLPSEKGKKGSYFDKHTNNCRYTYSSNRSTSFRPQRTVFSSGRRTQRNQNKVSTGFLSNPEELQHNIPPGGDPQSSSNKAKENVEEEVICLSENESISEISPNFCCYCFQKNSIRRHTKQRESNSQVDQKTSENDKKPEEGDLPGYPGPDLRTLVLERRNENTFSVKTESKLFGATSLRHRGSGDELSQPALDRQQVPEDPAREEEGQGAKRGQKLFCCISMDDTNEQPFQSGS